MGYQLSDRGRRALDGLFSHIAAINNAPRGVHHQFAVDPLAEQRLEDLQRQEVAFLDRINMIPVRDLVGQVIGLLTEDFIARRTDEAHLPRKPKYIGSLDDREYRLYETEFDTKLPWAIIDAWSRFPDFAQRYAKHVAISVALSRISVGWNGLTAAANTDPAANPLGQDVNIGWLQKLRLERADHVMGRNLVTAGGVTTATGTAKPIYIGPNASLAAGDYKNIDALAYDLVSGLPDWARASTEHVVIVGQDLVDEKYFPMINRPLSDTIDGGRSTSDEITRDIVMSAKQIGGRPAVTVPKFPAKTMAITPLKNLSIYWQEGSRRRYIKDEPEIKASLVDYNSVNEGYVIEDTDYMVMAENITFGARP